MAEVLRDPPSSSYGLRRLFRWYSEKFHTPLHLVENLPVDYILQHHYEAHAEDLVASENDHDLQEELRELTMTEAMAASAALARDRAAYREFEFDAEVKADVARDAKREAAAPKPIRQQPVFSAPEAGRTPFVSAAEPKPAVVIAKPAEPDIKMSFVDLDEFEKIAASDGLGPDPSK